MDNDRTSDSAKDFAGKVGSARDAAETLRDGSKAVAKKVGEYTLGALLVAGVVGFAVAMLMDPSRRQQQHWGDYWD